ncbi:hypothetical protein CbuD7D7780_11675 (plasmid) [Coxiella burnetii]|uniref:Uncharacterized protein n=1 Tax=Coxiella burnetii (strain Dugway 5J108-111) TaxID=434922 RepID=A9KH42_COXBN|nr:hypothetical protein [Coxiella burnetii]ABS78540.1 hypothetical protein CBUD_A0011 [Coxiella burnetii Dugway 5J108-111]OYK79186.1 hypothetical protein CbuD7E6568_11420 [Coxiella burnetii]OYK81225.1 hypothetical protein CbuD7D7780_11675 [Coxiella burnetii]
MKRLLSALLGFSIACSCVSVYAHTIQLGSADRIHTTIIQTGVKKTVSVRVAFYAGKDCQHLGSVPYFSSSAPYSNNDDFWLGNIYPKVPLGYTCGVLKFSSSVGKGEDRFALLSNGHDRYIATYPKSATVVLRK